MTRPGRFDDEDFEDFPEDEDFLDELDDDLPGTFLDDIEDEDEEDDEDEDDD